MPLKNVWMEWVFNLGIPNPLKTYLIQSAAHQLIVWTQFRILKTTKLFCHNGSVFGYRRPKLKLRYRAWVSLLCAQVYTENGWLDVMIMLHVNFLRTSVQFMEYLTCHFFSGNQLLFWPLTSLIERSVKWEGLSR